MKIRKYKQMQINNSGYNTHKGRTQSHREIQNA